MTLQTHHAPFPFPVLNWGALPSCLGSGQACYGLCPWGSESETDVTETGYGLLGPHTAVLSQLVAETGAEGPRVLRCLGRCGVKVHSHQIGEPARELSCFYLTPGICGPFIIDVSAA